MGTNRKLNQPIGWPLTNKLGTKEDQQEQVCSAKKHLWTVQFQTRNVTQIRVGYFFFQLTFFFFINFNRFILFWNLKRKSHNLILAFWYGLRLKQCLPWNCDLLAISQIFRIDLLICDRWSTWNDTITVSDTKIGAQVQFRSFFRNQLLLGKKLKSVFDFLTYSRETGFFKPTRRLQNGVSQLVDMISDFWKMI